MLFGIFKTKNEKLIENLQKENKELQAKLDIHYRPLYVTPKYLNEIKITSKIILPNNFLHLMSEEDIMNEMIDDMKDKIRECVVIDKIERVYEDHIEYNGFLRILDKKY